MCLEQKYKVVWHLGMCASVRWRRRRRQRQKSNQIMLMTIIQCGSRQSKFYNVRIITESVNEKRQQIPLPTEKKKRLINVNLIKFNVKVLVGTKEEITA